MKIEETPIAKENQICTCGHPLTRHIRVGSTGTR